ncbi:8129_t:CDS:2, partial [Funneliformis mosseae]
ISSSEKLMSTKNGQILIQEISRNLAESATPSSIQKNGSICALSPNPSEISLILSKENIICLYQRASDAEVKDIMTSDRV